MTHRFARVIDTRDFGGNTIRVGDVNGDGEQEIVFIQSYRPTREVSCITATDLNGRVLWQIGTPSADNGSIWSDLPVQIYDWDGDGNNEVLWIGQATHVESVVYDYIHRKYENMTVPTEVIRQRRDWARTGAVRYEGDAVMHVLDGATGQEKYSFPLPAPADECMQFANLTGGARADLIVKSESDNIWGIDPDGRVLWHWQGTTGHYPFTFDVDGDGFDEVFVGFALIDHDGKELWRLDDEGGHSDANFIVHAEGETRLFFGNGGLHCLNPAGETLWFHPLDEAQHVVAGCFRPDLGPVQIAVLNRGKRLDGGDRDPATLYMYDWNGNELWSRVQPRGSWNAKCNLIDWSGGDAKCVLITSRGAGRPAVYDGYGNIVDEFDDTALPISLLSSADYMKATGGYGMGADVLGDGREEAFFFGSGYCYIAANTRPLKNRKLHNTTNYTGL